MKNVCRSIMLHSEFMPAITGHRDWKYQVLGHYDGMTVKEAVSMDSTDFFREMFKMNVQYEGRMADYSTQYFFGFHSNIRKEREFWNCEMPFVFVSFIQFAERDIRKYQKYLESENYIKEEKIKLKSDGDVGRIYTLAYYTMDTSDLMLVIKCSRCESGVAMINNLHHDLDRNHPFTLRSSYSVMAINRAYVEESEMTDKVEGNIDLLELRIIERNSRSVNGLYQELEDRILTDNADAIIERKSLLGAEDEAIIIRNLPWKNLLPLYREKTGILCNSNRCTAVYANAVSAKLFHLIEEYRAEVYDKEYSVKVHAPLCDYLYKRIDNLYNGSLPDSRLSERKILVMLINAFRRVENAWYNGAASLDYNFFSMLFPFAVFVLLHEKKLDNQREYYDFIERLKLCTQNFAKSNRIFGQEADFNVRYFDIAPKFLAIYNAYIYQMKKLLNTKSDRQYEFLVCPGMNNKTEVKELYARTMEDVHLFKIEIPEAQMYMMKPMFITLGHEISHFVGTDLRNRDERFESVLKISGHMVSSAIRGYIHYVGSFEEKCLQDLEMWTRIEQKVYENLKFYIKRYHESRYLMNVDFDLNVLTPQQIENQKKYYDMYFQHTEVLKRILYRSIDDMLNNGSINIFEDIIWKSFEEAVEKENIKYENRDTYYEEHKSELLRCVEAFRGKRGVKTEHLTILNGIECIMSLMEECYADIVCILSLQLSIKDYLYNFVLTLDSNAYNTEKLNDMLVIARIAIVFSVLSYDMKDRGIKENDFRWHDTKFIQSENDERIINLYRRAEEFRISCIKRMSLIYEEEKRTDAWIIIGDNWVIKEIIKYLSHCRESYTQLIECKRKEQVNEIYLLSQMSDIDDFFGQATDILSRYEKEVYDNTPAWIKREKHRGKN